MVLIGAQRGRPRGSQRRTFSVRRRTIIHISIIQWKEGVSAVDKQQALNGVKEMAAKIPGMKNVWTKALRVQPEGYHDAFVIEFEDQAAADRYAKAPAHDAWTEAFLKIREAKHLSPDHERVTDRSASRATPKPSAMRLTNAK